MFSRLPPRHVLSGACLSALLLPCAFAAGHASTQQKKTQNDDDALPAIIVTGEKNHKNAFDTATSVTVFTEDHIKANSHYRSASDLTKISVNMMDLGSDNNLPTVRGIDGTGPAGGGVAFLAGSRPRLSLSIDGRTAAYNEFAFGTQSLWDIQQVEVLRGSQSYAQGRNAIAGAIVMQSKDPTTYWERALKLSLGNQHSGQAAAMLSGPIDEHGLSFRVSVDRQQRRSFMDFVSYDPVGSPRRFETTTSRAKLLLAPKHLHNFHSKLTLSQIKSRAPQSEAGYNPVGKGFSRERPVFETGSTASTWDLYWQASDAVSLDNKIIYTRLHNDRLVAGPRFAPASLEGKEWQWESILNFDTPIRHLKGLLGLHYFRGEQDEKIRLFRQDNLFDDQTETQALLGEVTWLAPRQIEVTFAARLERESHQRNGGSQAFRIDFDKSQTVFLPKIDVAWKESQNFVSGIKIARGYNPGGAGVTFARPIVTYRYEPEFVTNYEWYNRYRSAEGTLSLSSNIFFNHYRDMQLPYYLAESSVAIRNANKVQTYGAELNAQWQVSPYLDIFGALGLLKTDIKHYPGSGIEGNRLGRAPGYTARTGLDYRTPDGWEFGANLHLSGAYESTVNNYAAGKIHAYSQLNLHIARQFAQGRLSLYADNIFNSGKDIFIYGTDRREAVIQRPRAVGISAEFEF